MVVIGLADMGGLVDDADSFVIDGSNAGVPPAFAHIVHQSLAPCLTFIRRDMDGHVIAQLRLGIRVRVKHDSAILLAFHRNQGSLASGVIERFLMSFMLLPSLTEVSGDIHRTLSLECLVAAREH